MLELSQKEGGYNPDQFMKLYNKRVGNYYIYDGCSYNQIEDPELLKKIKGEDKEYDASILKNGSNISQMYETIKKTIVGQDEQIMRILTSLFKNQKVICSSLNDRVKCKLKENIIVYGSTGTGKTEILSIIAKIYQVPIVLVDSTTLSETGYVGRNVTDVLKELYLAADKNLETAQKGILVLDEFDKLAEKSKDGQTHVSRIGVQRSLLKVLDGADFYFDGKKFNTSELSIVALDAFSEITKDDDYTKVTSVDFQHYGIMRELMGRFSNLIAMNPLSKDILKQILVESDLSPINTYQELFELMKIKFSYEEEFIDYVAEKAIELKSGARSLKTIVDDAINSVLFQIFALECDEIKLVRPNGGKAYTLSSSKQKGNPNG